VTGASQDLRPEGFTAAAIGSRTPPGLSGAPPRQRFHAATASPRALTAICGTNSIWLASASSAGGDQTPFVTVNSDASMRLLPPRVAPQTAIARM